MHKLNHYMPRSLLKYWVSDGKRIGKGYDGVWCYLIQEDKLIYAEANGKKGFAFAIAEDLYVPVINGIRNIYVEGQWLSDLEGVFANFTRQFLAEKPALIIKSREEFSKFLLGFYSYKFRSKFEMNQVFAYLIENPSILNITQAKDTQVRVIENIVNGTNELYLRNRNCNLEIAKFDSKAVILGDRPFLELKDKGISFLPVNPSTIIGIKKKEDSLPFLLKYDVKKGDFSLMNELNRRIAEKSHYWIISYDLETLKQNIIYCKKKHDGNKNIDYEPFKEQLYGWNF